MKSKESDQSHIMTSQALLVEILRDLKHAFWPFQLDHARSLFIRAAQAAHCFNGSTNTNESALALGLASEKAARHRMQRGVWTSVRFGDMQYALYQIPIEDRPIVCELYDYHVVWCCWDVRVLRLLKQYEINRMGSKTANNKWRQNFEDINS